MTQVRCEYVISFPTGEKNLSVDMNKDLPSAREASVQSASVENTFQNKLAKAVEPQDQNEGGQVLKSEVESSAFVCEDLVYRITAVNKHSATLRLKINFHAKCDEKEIDLYWPRGGVKDYVKPGATSHVMALYRKNPFADKDNHAPEMSKLDISLNWKEYFEADFTMSNYSSASDKPAGDGIEVVNSSSGTQAQSDNHPLRRKGIRVEGATGSILNVMPTIAEDGFGVDENGTVYGSNAKANAGTGTPGDFVQADIADLPVAAAGQKACPICTILNESYAVTCEMCGTPF